MTRASHKQKGATVLEFALSFMLFWTALLAVVEFSRLMFAWNTAAEATRLAARLASICDIGSAQQQNIRARVAYFIEASGQVDLAGRTDWLQFSYVPTGCTKATCSQVEARLYDLRPVLMVPGVSQAVMLPEFRIRTPREAMQSSIAGESNTSCD